MKNIAKPMNRLIAAIIDTFFYLLFFQLACLSVVRSDSIEGILNSILLKIIIIFAVYPLVLPVLSLFLVTLTGGTLGKIITGLEIVDEKGERISFFRAFLRNHIGYIASGSLLWLGFIWIVIDSKRRGWHDMIAGTIVVEKRKSGIITGLIGLFLILFINLILTISIFTQYKLHEDLYQDIYSDITKTEEKKESNFQFERNDYKLNNTNESLEN